MQRILSSPITPFVKFVFPVVWMGGWVVFTIVEFGRPQPSDLKWMSLVIWVPATLILARSILRLQRVRIADDGLLISNYRREIHVPFAVIADVTYLRTIWGPQYVTLTFREKTPLGRRIIFIAAGGRDRRITAELRKRAGLPPRKGYRARSPR